MTVIRLLGKESQASTKEERISSTRIPDNKDLHKKLQKLEFCHSMKQEDNSPREENKSLLTAIRLINNEIQNPIEEKGSSTFSQNLHDQISDGVNDVLPGHNNKSSWVTVNNEKSKQRRKRKSSNQSRLLTNTN